MTTRPIQVLGLALFGVALTACGHSGSSPSAAPKSSSSSSSSSTSTSTAVSSTVPTSPPVPTTPPTVTRPPVSAAPNCTNAQIAVTATGNSGMGHIGVVLIFKNTSAQPCKLMGYPGVAALDSAGHQAVQATRTLNGYMRVLPAGEGPPVVTLASGQSASAFVEGTDVPTGGATSCPNYPKLLVTTPNTYQSVTINMSMPGCSRVQVHPVVPGISGSIVT